VSGVLACEDLAVGYHGRQVLQGVSFELQAGEIVALLGPNGGGKSTLLKTLSGIVPKLSGTATVMGDDVEALSVREIARRIGFVPQEESWQFEFSVEEVVSMGRLPISNGFFDTAEDHRAAGDAMSRAGCLELRDRPVTELSGGERQRVLIARALAQGTPILFLDEPTSHLDPQHQIEIASLLRGMARDGKSILVAVHDLPVAGAMADRGILICGGSASPARDMDELLESQALEKAYSTEFERLRTESGRLVVVARAPGGGLKSPGI